MIPRVRSIGLSDIAPTVLRVGAFCVLATSDNPLFIISVSGQRGPAMIDDILFGYVNRWLGVSPAGSVGAAVCLRHTAVATGNPRPQAPASPLLRAGEHA